MHVADLESRTGIYWLTFDDGEEYVGQSIEVVKRLATHRRKQKGQIVSVAFAPVTAADLDRAERWFIEQRDLAGARLRNKLITRTPGGPGPGTVVVSPGVSVRLPWQREDREPLRPGHAPAPAEPTPRQAAQWAELQAHPDWPQIRALLRGVLRETMSAADLTQARLWTISAMPNTVRLPGWRRLCTLNVGRIEAIYIEQDDRLGTVVCWNVAVPDRAEDAQLIRGLRAVDPGQRIGGEQHESYADPVVSLHIQGADLAQRVLDLPVMAELAYRFNTRYQRQGMALQRRWHNPLFAAGLLAPS